MRRSRSRSMRPSRLSRTCDVDSPLQTTSREVGRDVIEGGGPNQRLVRRRQHRQAGAETRTEDADGLVTLLRQPGDRPPRIEHCLAAYLRRPSDVGADDVIGAPELRRPAFVVIGKRQAQRGQLELVQQAAQADVAAGVRVPLRQHQHGTAAPLRRLLGKDTAPARGCSRGVASSIALGNVSRSPTSA